MDWNCSGRYELNINKLLLTIGVDQHQKKLSQDVMSHPFLETRRSREPYGSADWSVLPHKVLSLVTLCPCFGQYNRPLIWWRSRLSSFPLPCGSYRLQPLYWSWLLLVCFLTSGPLSTSLHSIFVWYFLSPLLFPHGLCFFINSAHSPQKIQYESCRLSPLLALTRDRRWR